MNVASHPELQRIARQFVSRTTADGLRIADLGRSLAAADTETLAELRDLSHQIAGSAGTFGWPSLSRSARELDELLRTNRTNIGLINEKVAVLLDDINALRA